MAVLMGLERLCYRLYDIYFIPLSSMDSVRNPGSLRGALKAGEALSAEIVSTHDIADMGIDDFMVVLVKTDDGQHYADTVICKGAKPQPGQVWSFLADEAGSFPSATPQDTEAKSSDEVAADAAPEAPAA